MATGIILCRRFQYICWSRSMFYWCVFEDLVMAIPKINRWNHHHKVIFFQIGGEIPEASSRDRAFSGEANDRRILPRVYDFQIHFYVLNYHRLNIQDSTKPTHFDTNGVDFYTAFSWMRELFSEKYRILIILQPFWRPFRGLSNGFWIIKTW